MAAPRRAVASNSLSASAFRKLEPSKLLESVDLFDVFLFADLKN